MLATGSPCESLLSESWCAILSVCGGGERVCGGGADRGLRGGEGRGGETCGGQGSGPPPTQGGLGEGGGKGWLKWGQIREGASRCPWFGGELRNVKGLGDCEKSPSLLWAHPLTLNPLE